MKKQTTLFFTLLIVMVIVPYKLSAQLWQQKGIDINGESSGDYSGYSVSMPDANTMAIGAINNDGSGFDVGHVRVYEWNGSAWIQKGLDINGETIYDYSGYSVSMPDANTVAIGARLNDGSGPNAGHVRVYAWNGTAWIQKGIDVDGEASGDESGYSVSMPDANTIAIGAPGNDGSGANAGHVRIYAWNGTAWIQKGIDMNGEVSDDQSGWCVSMPDANTVAIGARLNDGSVSNAGHVRIYAWNGTAWIQKGIDIDGEASNNQSGWWISMPDANTLAIGAPYNSDSGTNAGHVRVYAWNGSAWIQKGIDIDGEAAEDQSGWCVSMPDANTLAIGAPTNSGSAFNAGHVRIYVWNGSAWIQRGTDIDGEQIVDLSGSSVSMPDANTVVIGAPYNDDSGNNAGHVRVYYVCNTTNTISPLVCAVSYTSPSGNYTWTSSGTYMDTIPNTAGCDSIITINLTISNIVDQNVSIAQYSLCDSGSTTVSITSSQTGVYYYLRNDANNAVVDGPLPGTGSALSFNTGTINTNTTYNVYAEKLNDYGLEFNASQLQRAEITSPFETYTNTITVEAWVYLASPFSSFPWMGQSQPGADNMSTNVWIWHGIGIGNNFQWYVNDNGNWRFANSTALTNATGWHHIATVADASSIRIYIDGVLDVTGPGITSSIINSPSSAIHIGNDPRYPASVSYHGSFTVSDFRLWNTALTQSQITNNMNGCLVGNEPGLQHYNKFNDNSGMVATAITGPNASLSASMNPLTDWVFGNGICQQSCSFEMSQIVTVNVNYSSTSSISPTVCNTYTTPSGNNTYSTSGIYMDTITNIQGCDSVITINLTVNTNTTSTISPTVCNSYTTPSGNNTYSTSGTFMDTIANSVGCDSIITINLTINTVNATVTNNSPTLTANPSGATYQWINCSGNVPVNGATNQTFTATANGQYAVIVTQNNCSDTSACATVNNVGLSENNFASSIVLYPNPTSGNITIDMGVVYSNLVITIRNILGQELQTKMYDGSPLINLTIEGESGIYLVELKTNDKTGVIRVVKN